jgi:hypothetical protein
MILFWKLGQILLALLLGGQEKNGQKYNYTYWHKEQSGSQAI